MLAKKKPIYFGMNHNAVTVPQGTKGTSFNGLSLEMA